MEQTLNAENPSTHFGMSPCKMPRNLPPIEEIIPHSGRMLLVNRVLEFGQNHGKVEVVLEESKPYFENGKFQSVWLIELMAQAVGTVTGYEMWANDIPRAKAGFIVAIDNYKVTTELPLLAPQEILLVEVQNQYSMPPFGVYRAEVFCKGIGIASIILKTCAQE